MSLFKRIASAFARPEHETMAETIGARMTRVLAHLNQSEPEAAIEELGRLSQDVSEFVEGRDTAELRNAVEYWALHERGESVTATAIFLADNDLIRRLPAILRQHDQTRGVGLVWLQEAFNQAGLIMSPTVHDQETGPFQEIIRQTLDRVTGKVAGAPDPMGEIADVLWPETDDEAALRTRIARACGASTARVAAELFALRWYALELARNTVFPDPAKRGPSIASPLFEAGVYLALGERTQGNDHIDIELKSWVPRAAHRYASTGHRHGDGPWSAQSTEWLARVSAEFETSFGKEGSNIGLIGAAEFDLALARLRKVMEQLASG